MSWVDGNNYFDKTCWVKMRPEAHPGKKSPTDLPINVQLVKNRLVLICGTWKLELSSGHPFSIFSPSEKIMEKYFKNIYLKECHLIGMPAVSTCLWWVQLSTIYYALLHKTAILAACSELWTIATIWQLETGTRGLLGIKV